MSVWFALVLVLCFFINGVQTEFEAFCGGGLFLAMCSGVTLIWVRLMKQALPSTHQSLPTNTIECTIYSKAFLSVCLFVCLITWSCVHFVLLQISLLGVHLWLCCGLCVRVCIDVCICGRGCKSACMRLCTVWPLSVKVESSAEAYGRPQPSPRHLTIELYLQEKPAET